MMSRLPRIQSLWITLPFVNYFVSLLDFICCNFSVFLDNLTHRTFGIYFELATGSSFVVETIFFLNATTWRVSGLTAILLFTLLLMAQLAITDYLGHSPVASQETIRNPGNSGNSTLQADISSSPTVAKADTLPRVSTSSPRHREDQATWRPRHIHLLPPFGLVLRGHGPGFP